MSAENTNFFSSNPNANSVNTWTDTISDPIGLAGREKIIELLNKQLTMRGLRGVILHGRRQIGKSWLVQKFGRICGRPYIYFQATRDSIANLDLLRGALNRCMTSFGIKIPNAPERNFSKRMYDLLQLGFRLCKEAGAVFIIDEFNYLVESGEIELSVFQCLFDEVKNDANALVILCGSNSGILSTLTVTNRPLYGRFSWIKEVEPISYKTMLSLLSNIEDFEHKVMAAILCSGMPELLLSAIDSSDFLGFITYLLDYDILQGMVDNLFQAERLNIDFMNDITALLSKNTYSFGEVKSKLVSKYEDFDELYQKALSVRLIEEVKCLFSRHLSNSRLVRVTNTIMPLNMEFRAKPDEILNKFKLHDTTIREFFGLPFEDLCAQFLKDVLNLPNAIRCYWEDIVGAAKERREVDVILQTPGGDVAYICECKFKGTQVNTNIISRLLKNIGYMNLNGVKATSVIVSFGGYTDQARSLAEEKNVLLYSGDDIKKWALQ